MSKKKRLYKEGCWIKKRCPCCEKFRSVSRFCGDNSTQDGYATYCKGCIKEKNRQRYLDNRVKRLLKAKVYQETNRKAILERQKKKYRENEDYRKRIVQKQALYNKTPAGKKAQKSWRTSLKGAVSRKKSYIRNKERIIESVKAWNRKNRSLCNSYTKNWYNNTEKGKQQTKASSQNRRNRERKAGKLTAAIIQIVEAENIEQFGTLTCVYCKKRIKKTYHLDHIIPLVKGGKNTKLNLYIACPTCNTKKGTMLASDFRRSMLQII